MTQRGRIRFPDQWSENATVNPPINAPRIVAETRSETHPDWLISKVEINAVRTQENRPAIPPTRDMKYRV